MSDETWPEISWNTYVTFFANPNKQLEEINKFYGETSQSVRIRQAIEGIDSQIIILTHLSKGEDQQRAQIVAKIIQLLKIIHMYFFDLVFNAAHESTMILSLTIFLEILDKYEFIFHNSPEIFFHVFTTAMLKDAASELIINSQKVKKVLMNYIQNNFLSNQFYVPINDVLITFLIVRMAHFDFLENTDLELLHLIIKCFKFSKSQETKIAEYKEQLIQDSKSHSKRQKLKQEQPKKIEDMFSVVPEHIHRLLALGLALAPCELIYVPIQNKVDFLNPQNESIFDDLITYKILQRVCSEQKWDLWQSNYNLFEMLIPIVNTAKFITTSREILRTLNCLLNGYDRTALWIQFDSQNMFDNSNQMQCVIHGDPIKLPLDSGLYYDSSGVDFIENSVIELVPPLELEQFATVSFWMVIFNERNTQERSQRNNHRMKTLLGSKDGHTSSIFMDARQILFGVTNISDEEGFEPGLKFFPQNAQQSMFQGWNHVTIILDNNACQAFLYINGHFDSVIKKVKSNLSIRFVGNHQNLQQPFGYLCDLRIYPKILSQEQIKVLGNYNKKYIILHEHDILTLTQKIEVKSEKQNLAATTFQYELQKILNDNMDIPKNYEIIIEVMKGFCYLAKANTQLRLEIIKIGLLDQIIKLGQHQNYLIRCYAHQLINNLR